MGYKVKNFLVVIPARCGSKGIIQKNIVDFKGYPLIYHTIKIAKQLKNEQIIDEIYISTDCEEIKKVCEGFGVEVKELRDKKLSKDDTKTIDVIRSILMKYQNQNIKFEHIILLQPTSPLRTYKHVIESIEKFKINDSNSLISVCKDASLSDSILYYSNGKYLIPREHNHNLGKRRQENNIFHIRNGAI